MARKQGAAANQEELVSFAIEGIDAQIQALIEKRSALVGMRGGSLGSGRGTRRAAGVRANAAAPAKKRKVSEATRRKLKAAAKKRWARERTEKAKAA